MIETKERDKKEQFTGSQRGRSEIDVEPFRKYALMLHHGYGVSWASICFRLNWIRNFSKRPPGADTTRLKRTLGISPQSKYQYPTKNKTITYKTAVELCKAFGADPVDFNL